MGRNETYGNDVLRFFQRRGVLMEYLQLGSSH